MTDGLSLLDGEMPPFGLRTALRGGAILLRHFKLICPVQSFPQKYSAGPVGQIRGTGLRVLSHRGALANVIDAGEDAVDAEALLDGQRGRGRRSRVVLMPRRWHQVGGSDSINDGGKKARSPGRARYKP
jgi:hypothetical protein